MDFITLLFFGLALVVWYYWIRGLKNWLRGLFSQQKFRDESKLSVYRSNNSISIGIKYFPVRLSGDLPEFEGLMRIDAFGFCSINSAEVQINPSRMFSWNTKENSNGADSIEIQIAGKIFTVLQPSVLKAKFFLSENLPNLHNRRHPE